MCVCVKSGKRKMENTHLLLYKAMKDKAKHPKCSDSSCDARVGDFELKTEDKRYKLDKVKTTHSWWWVLNSARKIVSLIWIIEHGIE